LYASFTVSARALSNGSPTLPTDAGRRPKEGSARQKGNTGWEMNARLQETTMIGVALSILLMNLNKIHFLASTSGQFFT
jgi:hypothetical protein